MIWSCWILLGGGFFVLFVALGVMAVVLHSERQTAGSPEQAQANDEKDAPTKTDKDATSELLRMDETPSVKPAPAPIGEAERVLGHGMKPPHRDDPLLAPDAPPPLPPPHRALSPSSSQPSPPMPGVTNPKDEPPPPAANPAPSNSEAAFAKRLEASEEDLRGQLSAISELRLVSDLDIQGFRQEEAKERQHVNSRDQAALDFAFNMRLNRAMRQAALKEGLPVMSGPNCQLDPAEASLVQTLSKDLRDMGFVSIPGAPGRARFSSGRVANVGGTTIANGSPNPKVEAFKEWCDQNRVEKFRGALATLMQMLQVEDAPTRLLLVRELAKIEGGGATAALAKRALADLSPDVRKAAIDYLRKRPAIEYVSILLHGLRYPWAPVADHAAVALCTLKPSGVVPSLVNLLDQPDPSLPFLDSRTRKPMVRDLVRLNHLRNCLLCHAPSANKDDGLVRGLVPTPGQPLPRLYYASQTGDFVRADITFLRQDFSVNLPALDTVQWPKEQRFDFVSRTRPAKPEELRDIAQKSGSYPQRDVVLHTLSVLTGKDAGDSSTAWRALLGLSKEKTITKTEVETKTGAAGQSIKRSEPQSIPKEVESKENTKNRQP